MMKQASDQEVPWLPPFKSHPGHNATEISPRKQTSASETFEHYLEYVHAKLFEVSFISFRYYFNQKLGTNAKPRKPY
jgi:hypothetical protein